jgi:hypothetical protein
MASVSGSCLGHVLTRFCEFDFDVIAEAVEPLHELTFGEVGEIAAQEVGVLRLGKAHAAASFFLSDGEAANGASDL